MTVRPTRAFVSTSAPAGIKFANLNGSHGNHFAHQKLMDTWKALGIAVIRANHLDGPIDAPVTITATVHRTTRAKSDAHNVTPTIKALIDAAVACGVIEDDHDGIVARLIIEPGEPMKLRTVDLLIEAS